MGMCQVLISTIAKHPFSMKIMGLRFRGGNGDRLDVGGLDGNGVVPAADVVIWKYQGVVHDMWQIRRLPSIASEEIT
jgi:hypothetical protein